MSTLYEIQAQFQAALARLDEAETEAEYHDAEVALSALDSARDEKLEACICHLKNLRARAEPFRLEIERLQAQLERLEAQADRFTNYIRSNITEGERWARNTHSISWRRSERVKILNRDAVPGAYLREKLSYEPDLVAIKKDLECGANLSFAVLEARQNLTIK